MDLLHGQVKKIYFKYLTAAFGSAMISSIYGIVDMAMVGQYQGSTGTAALAVVAPIWNIIYSLGLLIGVGGSVWLSTSRGRKRENEAHQYFTLSLVMAIIISFICWISIIFFDTSLLTFFGANEELLMLAKQYLLPVKFCVPVFLMNQMLAAFLRNDDAPSLATKAVLIGGVFNIVGDYVFVFMLDMGIMGAGLATALGATLTLLIMLTHFKTTHTLRIIRIDNLFYKLKNIVVTGFSTFIIDIAMGVLTILFNRQIILYLGTDALAVYGVIVNMSTIVQCSAYSIGQASQPLFSVNLGANQMSRITDTLKYALYSVVVFSLFWTMLMMLFPIPLIKIFMNPSQHILEMAPGILRMYGLSFLLLPLNIFSTYYFQSLLKPMISLMISLLRGVVISGLFILLLPIFFGGSSMWLAMLMTESIVAIGVIVLMKRFTLDSK